MTLVCGEIKSDTSVKGKTKFYPDMSFTGVIYLNVASMFHIEKNSSNSAESGLCFIKHPMYIVLGSY